jgi:hypothetical protein
MELIMGEMLRNITASTRVAEALTLERSETVD